MATTAVGLFAVAGIQDGMQRSRTFWSTIDTLHTLGVDSQSLDAGLAYAGLYRYNPTYRGEDHVGPYLATLPPAEKALARVSTSPHSGTADRRIRVSFDPSPRYSIVARRAFRSWWRSGYVLILLRDDVERAELPPAFLDSLASDGTWDEVADEPESRPDGTR